MLFCSSPRPSSWMHWLFLSLAPQRNEQVRHNDASIASQNYVCFIVSLLSLFLKSVYTNSPHFILFSCALLHIHIQIAFGFFIIPEHHKKSTVYGLTPAFSNLFFRSGHCSWIKTLKSKREKRIKTFQTKYKIVCFYVQSSYILFCFPFSRSVMQFNWAYRKLV